MQLNQIDIKNLDKWDDLMEKLIRFSFSISIAADIEYFSASGLSSLTVQIQLSNP